MDTPENSEPTNEGENATTTSTSDSPTNNEGNTLLAETSSQSTDQGSQVSNDEGNNETLLSQTAKPSDKKDSESKDDEEASEDNSGNTEGETEEAEEFEDYELVLSEDSPLSEEELNELADFAGTNRLTQEQANALVNFREESFERGADAFEAELLASVEEAKTEILSDDMFRGDNKAVTIANIKRATETLGDEDLVQALNHPFIGNNLHLAKFFNKIGAMLANDKIIVGGVPQAGQDNSRGSTWYAADGSNK